MQWQLLWYVLAGFILGFACSTLWEWLYFRVRRVNWQTAEIERLEDQLRHDEAQRQQLQAQQMPPPSAAAHSDDAAAVAPSVMTSFPEPASPWQSESSANRAPAPPSAYQSPGVFLDSETAESLHEETHYDASRSAADWDTEIRSTRYGAPSAEQPLPPTSLQTDAAAISSGLPPAGRRPSEYERFDEADDVAFADERSAEPQEEQTDDAEPSLADAAPVSAPETSDVEFVEPEADAPSTERVAAEPEDEAADAAELGIADAATAAASDLADAVFVAPEAHAPATEPEDEAADAAKLGIADAATAAASDTADAVSITPEAHAPRADADLVDAGRATSVAMEAAPEPFAEDESTAESYAAPLEELPSDRTEEPPAEAGYVASVVDDTDFAAARNAEHEEPPVEAEFTPLAAEPPAQTSDPAFTVINEDTRPSVAEYSQDDADDVAEYRHVDRANAAPGRLAADAETQDQPDATDAPARIALPPAEGEYRTDTAATAPGGADADRDASPAGLVASGEAMSAVDTISDAIAAVAVQEYVATTLQAAEPGAVEAAEPAGPAVVQAPDNLSLIKGIGSKYRQRLYAAGIYTFHQLHLTDAAILAEVTGAFASAKPESWRTQAGDLAAEYDRTAAQYDGPPPDDFAEIHRLSPDWVQRLYLVGICSYADLAARSPDDLHALLPDLAEESQFEPAKWTTRAAALAQRKAEEDA